MNRKICILSPYYIPVKGGITSYASNLVKTLGKYGFTTTVIARYGNTGENVYITNQKIYFILKSFLVLCQKRPDVIHAHSNWYTLTTPAIYKIIHPKTRLIFTFHTEPMERMKGLKKKMFEWLLSKCNTVTFVSAALMKNVEKNLKLDTKTKKKVVYAGVTEHEVNKEVIGKFREKYGLDESSPILSFIGPLVWKKKVKGVKMLVRAFKDFTKIYPNAKLLIIGDGEYRADVEEIVKELDFEYNVIFTGFLDDVFVPLSITDIYTHISLQEGGVSMSILEAMSMGKPVIATRVGGIPELIIDGENGILVDAEPKAIANAIIELYSDNEEMKELGENARKTVEKGYTWKRISEMFMEIYEGILT